jgi:hypothetical protein
MTEMVKTPRFFIYIIESPSAPDIYHGRSEGVLVAKAVELDGIPSATRTVINPTAFYAALSMGLPDVMKLYPDRIPILHISAHGASGGIQLSSGDVINWLDLRQILMLINESLDGFLLLCMSACEGFSACQMAMQEGDGPHPYFFMVGNYGKPTWSDTAVAYSAFYHLLSKGYNVSDAVAGMRAASGDDKWIAQTAEQSKRGYLEYLQSIVPSEAQQVLQAAAEEQDVPPEAKALENKERS